MSKTHLRTPNKTQWSSGILSKPEDLIKKDYSMRYAVKAMDLPVSSLQKW